MAQFICGRLKKREGVWRVDGIGNLRASRFPGSRVQILLSRIETKNGMSPDALSAYAGESFPLNAHVAWLWLFTPGSVWEGGAKSFSPPSLNNKFLIDTRHCIYTFPSAIPSAEVPIESLLPATHLDFGDNSKALSQTKFALVRVIELTTPRTDWLIIPTAELFRFYVGASARFLSKALTATIDHLIDVERTTLVDQHLTIYDRTGTLTKREAAFYGRTLTSDNAREAFHGPHKYLAHMLLTKKPGENPPLFINSTFPFADRTSLEVAGKRIPLRNMQSGKKEWAVLVTRIRDCSYPLGINSIHTIKAGSPQGEAQGSGGNFRAPRPPKTDLENPAEINDLPADPELGRLFTRNPVTSFDQINAIKTSHEWMSEREFNSGKRAPQGEVNGYTFEGKSGEGVGSGNQGVDLVDINVKGTSRDITLFIETIKCLKQRMKEKWEIKTRGCQETDVIIDGEIVTSFVDPGKQYKWYLITESDTATRPRKVVWVQIKIGNHYFHLVEMELKTPAQKRSLLFMKPKSFDEKAVPLTPALFKTLLILTAVHNGWPPEHKEWDKKSHKDQAKALFDHFQLIRLHHPYIAKRPTKKQEENSAAQPVPAAITAEQWAIDIQSKIIKDIL